MDPILFDFKLAKIIKYGDFVLKSGEKSNTYIDCRKLFGLPDCLQLVAEYMLEIAPECDYICAVPYGAIPLATVMLIQSEIPLIMLRKERKPHGMNNIIEGVDIHEITADSKCLLVEDVVTTGGSLNTAINQLVANSAFTRENIHPIAVFNRGIQPIPHLWSLADIAPKRLCVALDTSSIEVAKDLLDKIYPYIDMIKVHHDGFSDITKSQLIFQEFKKTYNTTIVADRKFADTGNTTALQYKSGQFANWADYVTVHTVAGEGTIKTLARNDNIKMLVVWTMTSSDEPIGDKHIKSIQIINKYRRNIPGVITRKGALFKQMWQKWGVGPRPEIWAPGINMTKSSDGSGQTWVNIENITGDVYIVGRDICEHPNPVDMAKKYKKHIDIYNTKAPSE